MWGADALVWAAIHHCQDVSASLAIWVQEGMAAAWAAIHHYRCACFPIPVVD